MKKLSPLFFVVFCCLLAATPSCISQKTYQELLDRYQGCIDTKRETWEELEACRQNGERLEKNNAALQEEVDRLRDTINWLRSEHQALSNRYANLLKMQEALQKGSQQEIRDLLAQLQRNREMLQKKEDELRAIERTLNERSAAIKQLERNVQEQQEKVIALERILRQKDSVANALKQKISDALLNFEGKGLTVRLKNGKVYVSMDEKLMFASGSSVVDKRGAEALKNLASILERNTDISVLVEGHTDDVPYAGSGQLTDNWDLSCKRATSVVRILLSSAYIDASRITAAGRASFVPLRTEKTPEARSANRRIEVILSPKLDEVLKILEN